MICVNDADVGEVYERTKSRAPYGKSRVQNSLILLIPPLILTTTDTVVLHIGRCYGRII